MENQWKMFNEKLIKKIRFERDGFLVDVILQNYFTKQVLFGASMTKETLEETIQRGIVILFSKSRNVRWIKGETSGDYLKVVSMTVNCHKDHLLIQVLPVGKGVCYKKTKTGRTRAGCFYRVLLEMRIVEIDGKNYRVKHGNAEEVDFYEGFGWLTSDELFELRQIFPRIAP